MRNKLGVSSHGMPRAFLYIVAASASPDKICCAVPFRVDDKEIFFGPCKKRLRERFRSMYLSPSQSVANVSDEVYLIGFNGGNRQRVRKVVWVGRLRRVMTFAQAFESLAGERYEKMRIREFSPVHLRPLRIRGRLIGYEHRGREHEKRKGWILDLVKSRDAPGVRLKRNQLLLKPGVSSWEAFPRDICFVLENLFFATAGGLPIDQELLEILRSCQPRRQVDEYAVFGYKRNGVVEGLTGSWLPLEGRPADEVVAWVKRRVTKRLPEGQRPITLGTTGRC